MTRKLTCTIAAVLALACSAPVSAAPTEPVKLMTEGTEVQMQLSTTDLVVGEPLIIMLRVTNISAPVRIGNFGLKPSFPEGNDLEVQIHRPGELPVRYEGGDAPGVYSAQEQNLNWGDSVHLEYTVLYDKTQPNGYAFSKPGNYIIDVRVHHTILRDPQPQTIAMNGVKITVREPTGPAAEAFKLINNQQTALVLQKLVSDNTEILNNLRTLVEKYPQTPYAPLALYVLGASALRMGQLDDGIATFKAYLQRYPTHIRTSDALFNIVRGNTGLKKLDLARDWFYYLKDHDPSYPLIRRENPTAAFYYFTPDEQARARRWWLYEKPWEIKLEEPAQQSRAPQQPQLPDFE